MLFVTSTPGRDSVCCLVYLLIMLMLLPDCQTLNKYVEVSLTELGVLCSSGTVPALCPGETQVNITTLNLNAMMMDTSRSLDSL